MDTSFLLGCLNGGAQIRSTDGSSPKELITKLEEMYNALPCKSLNDTGNINELYDKWLGGKDSEKCNAVLHTTYHEIEKNVNALNIKW